MCQADIHKLTNTETHTHKRRKQWALTNVNGRVLKKAA